jgi:hypothetical protein
VFWEGQRNIPEVIFVTLVQEAASIMEKLPKRNQQVVLDLLRVMGSQTTYDEMTGKDPDEKMRTAALELAGLWKDHGNELSIEETVRDLRKGRRFDR